MLLFQLPAVPRVKTVPGDAPYFLKEFRRGVRETFSFGALAKARGRLQVLRERLKELHETLLHRGGSLETVSKISG
ncbi:MAG: hypothetical protein AAB967_01510, partial [Patescibacteria group bacterium]